MKVIDARSGDEIGVGSQVRYPGGEGYDVLALTIGVLEASATVRTIHNGGGRSEHVQVRCRVRYTHPAFFLQKVVFFPS